MPSDASQFTDSLVRASAAFEAGSYGAIAPHRVDGGYALAAAALPDLVFDNVEIQGDPIDDGDEYGPNFQPGDTVRLDWDVDNRGAGAAGASRVAIRLISDVDGIVVDTNGTDAIGAGGSDSGQYDSFTIPSNLSPGLYGIELVADDQRVVSESSESNNTYLILIRVEAGRADLVIDNVEINGTSIGRGDEYGTSVMPGDTVRVDWDVDNNGSAAAAASRVAIRLVSDVDGMVVDTNTTDAISAGGSDTGEYDSFVIPSTLSPGLYGIELIADDQDAVDESSESNNDYLFLIRVGAAPPPPTGSDEVRQGADTLHSLPFDEVRSGTIEAEPIAGDGVTSDQAGGMVDKDWYKVTLEKGHNYYFGASSVSLTTNSVAISLYADGSTMVAGVREGSAPTFTFDTANQVEATQTYYLAVSAGGSEPAWRTATGDYAMVVQKVGGTPPAPVGGDDYRDEDTDTSAPLGLLSIQNSMQYGIIGPADSNDMRGDKDVFKATLVQGQTYVFTMSGVAMDGASPLAQSLFTIREAGSFTNIAATSSEGPNAIMEFYARNGGDYYIRTGSGGANYTTAQGGYRLEMRQPDGASSDFDPGNSFNNPLSISAAIGSSGAYSYVGRVGGGDPADVFQVVAPRAGQLTVDLTNLSADIDLVILDSSGLPTTGGVSNNASRTAEHLSVDLTAGETVYLNVVPYTSTQGDYTLTVRFGASPPPPVVGAMPNSASLIGNHLNRTLAEFAAGAYGEPGGSTARSHLMSDGWTFYDSDNVLGTSLADISWSGIIYNNSVAQAVVARSADGLVISFRGTNGWADVPHWVEMDQHLNLFGELVAAVNELIITDKSIKHVFVTGHSLGAAMVDPFMATHPNFHRADGSYVDYKAITFAHPDFQTAGTEALLNGALTPYRSNLPSAIYKTYRILEKGVPDFGPDSRVVSYHNHLDPVRLADSRYDGLIPRVENIIRFAGPTVSGHDSQLYVYGADFLARSGVGDNVISLGLNGPGKNEFLIPAPGNEHNTLTSPTGGLLMVGGTGDDIYVVTATGTYKGDTIIEYTQQSAVVGDTLRLTSGFNAFDGTVRLVPSSNGMDLLVYPVSTGLIRHELPYIRIYNHFTALGRVEWIEWAGTRIALPSSIGRIDGWNNSHYKAVGGSSIFYVEQSDGSLTGSVTAVGGAGFSDTVSFQPLKDMRVTADLSQRIGTLWTDLKSGFQSFAAVEAAAELPEAISVDLTDMENIVGSDRGDDLTGSDVANGLSGGDGDDRLSGGLGNDYLDGGSGGDVLDGGPGQDLMDGGPGADQLTGGADSDSYLVDDPADFITEGVGEGASDRVYVSVSYTLGAGVHVETLSTDSDAGTDPLVLAGNEVDNRIIGNDGANALYGMAGSDRLEGLGGNDTLVLTSSAFPSAPTSSTVTLQPGSEGQDKWVTNVYYGGGVDDHQLKVGGWADQYHSLIRFDLGAPGLPSQVSSATVRLYYFSNNGASPTGVLVDKVNTAWTEAYVWQDYTLGYTNLVQIAPSSFGWFDIDVTQTANEWLANPSTNFGLQLRPTANNNNFTFFVSSDATSEMAANRPQLVLNWGATGTPAEVDIGLGGSGNDIFHVDSDLDQVIELAGEGTDEVQTALAAYMLAAEVEILRGLSTSGQALTGNSLDNLIIGGAGNDRLDGGPGADRMEGGTGDDVYAVSHPGDQVIELAGGGHDTVRAAASYALAAGSQVEVLTVDNDASTLSLNLIGNEFAQRIFGNAGANLINGMGGADVMFGLGGGDYYVADGDDQVFEAPGEGFDIVAVLTSYRLAGGSEIEMLVAGDQGGTAPLNLIGNERGQQIVGNAGANLINGMGGADALSGRGGNDYFIVDGDDVVYEATGGGFDVVAAIGSHQLTGGSHVELLVTTDAAGTAALNLIGNELGQQIVGNAGNNILNGMGGADVMSGLGGDDYYVVDGDDAVYEGEGNGFDTIASRVSHVLAGGSHVEMLATANEGAVTALDLTGNERGQTIWGNHGANRLDGGNGSDVLRGLGGADIFVFSTGLGPGNIDRILDFQAGVDRIAIDDNVFANMSVGNLAAGAFRTGTGAQDADDRIIYDPASGALLFDFDGVGGAAAVRFATLSTGLALSSADFLVV